MPGHPENPFPSRAKRQKALTPFESDQAFVDFINAGYGVPVGFHKPGRPIGDDGVFPDATRLRVVKVRPDRYVDDGRATVPAAEDFLRALRSRGLWPFRDTVHYDSVVICRDPRLPSVPRMGRWSPGGATAVLVLLLLLSTLPLAHGNGATPISPNPSSIGAQEAFAATSTGESAYVETFQISQQIIPLSNLGCAGTCRFLQNGYANISDPTSGLGSGSKIVTGQYWLNLSSGCGGSCPPYTLTCDTVASSPTHGNSKCYLALAAWGNAQVTTVPHYNLTRLLTYSIPEGASWIGSSHGASLTSSVTSFTPAYFTFGSNPHPVLLGYVVTAISWAVPLPAGSYLLSQTTIEFLNTSTFLTAQQFDVLSTWILIQWANLPVPSCVTCDPPNYHSATLNYLFELVASSPPPTGGSGILPPPALNSTIPPGLNPVQIPAFSPVVLQMTAPQQTSPGNWTAVVTWLNNFLFLETSGFEVVSPYLVRATNATVSVNGVPLPKASYGVSSTSLYVYPGAVGVPNGSYVALTITFHYVPTFDPTAPVGIVDGFGVTVATVVIALAVAAAAFLGYREATDPKFRRSRAASSALGSALLALLALVVIYL